MAQAWAIAMIVLAILTSAAVTVTRFYVRLRTRSKLSADDYTILLSLFLQLSLFSIGVVQLEGLESVLGLEIFYAGTFLYFGTLWMAKISINLFHIKLTSRLGRIHTVAKFSLYLTCVAGIIVVLLQIFGCWPIQRRFDTAGVEGCDLIQNSKIFWVCFVLNLVTDIILIVLPYPALMLISERRIRVTICIVFALAGSIIIMTIVRAVLITVAPASNNAVIIVLSNLECGVLLGISALPGISHLFTTKYVPSGPNSGWRRAGDAMDLSNRDTKSRGFRSGPNGSKTNNSAIGITDLGSRRPQNAETESARGLENGEVENGTWVSSGSSPSGSFDMARQESCKGPKLGQIFKKTTIEMKVVTRDSKKR